MLFETAPQSTQNGDGLFEARLGNIYLLKPACQCMIFFEDTAILGIGCRANTTDISIRQHRLDQVRCVHDTARCSTCTYNCMNFINKKNCSGIVTNLINDSFKAFFEIAAIFCSRYQRAHIQRINGRIAQNFRHALFGNHSGQTFCECGFANTGIADIQGIVLAPATKNLHRSFDFNFATNQRIDFAINCQLIKVSRIFCQRTGTCVLFTLNYRRLLAFAILSRHLRQSM